MRDQTVQQDIRVIAIPGACQANVPKTHMASKRVRCAAVELAGEGSLFAVTNIDFRALHNSTPIFTMVKLLQRDYDVLFDKKNALLLRGHDHGL